MAKPPKKTRTSKTSKASKGFPLFKYALVTMIWAGFLGFCLLMWFAAELPEITKEASFSQKTSISFMDRNGEMITRYGGLQGEKVAVFDLPAHTIWAILATEDRRFYTHYGVDPLGIARAMVVNLKSGSTVQGGSTLTQQLAKNLFLSNERSLKRKLQELLLAFWLEYKFTKDEILTAYINRVYFGSGAYGIDAAARVYFNKSSTKLSLEESALIAGLLKAPSRYSPLNNPSLARSRTQTVLAAMVDAGYIEPSEAKLSLNYAPTPFSKPRTDHRTERYFTDWLMDQIPHYIGGISEDIIVETTLDLNLQKNIEEDMADMLGQFKERQVTQAAVLLVNDSSEVITMIGGADYGVSQFNRSTQALRQPGSAFKPFVYLTAYENGWRSDDTILDEPLRINEYAPANFNDEYFGTVTLEEALARSMNTATVRLFQELGSGAVIKRAKSLGVHSPLKAEAGLALGASEVTLFDMVQAYSTISRKGRAKVLHGIDRITTQDGTELYRYRSDSTQIGSRSAYSDLISGMERVISEGTGRAAKLPFSAAGKTGTSSDYRDAWFMGFTGDYTGGVWVGNDDNTPMRGVTGGSMPAQLWAKSMKLAHKGNASRGLDGFSPSGFFESLIDRLTVSDTPEDNRERKSSGYNP